MNYHYTMTDANQDLRPRGFADGLGVFLSQLCLAHCFLLPALLAVLPSLDFHSIPGGEALHFAILLLATPTAIYALLTGYRFHGRALPMGLGALGLGLLWVGSTLEAWHLLMSHSHAHWVGALGSAILILAHLANRRCVKGAQGHCDCGHTH
jgi:hypothetical protein